MDSWSFWLSFLHRIWGSLKLESTRALHVKNASFPGCTFSSRGIDRITVLSGGEARSQSKTDPPVKKWKLACVSLTEHLQFSSDWQVAVLYIAAVEPLILEGDIRDLKSPTGEQVHSWISEKQRAPSFPGKNTQRKTFMMSFGLQLRLKSTITAACETKWLLNC